MKLNRNFSADRLITSVKFYVSSPFQGVGKKRCLNLDFVKRKVTTFFSFKQ